MTDAPPRELIDRCQRRLNYLRISVTDRCNLRCAYCLPSEDIPRLRHEDVLRYEEILRVARVAAGLGITKVRVTGGEPLVRRGVVEFLAELARIPGIRDVSLTTNGLLLSEFAGPLKAAGVSRINISMDTLDPGRYREITGVDAFAQAWEGIHAAQAHGFHPIKLNVVAMRGVNDDELPALARLSLDSPLHVRFIEFMPIGRSRFQGDPLLYPEIKERIGTVGRLLPVDGSPQDGPAHRYRFEGAPGEVGFIPAISHHFCSRCNRLLPAVGPPRGREGAAALRRHGRRDRGDLLPGDPPQAHGPQPGGGRAGARLLSDALHRRVIPGSAGSPGSALRGGPRVLRRTGSTPRTAGLARLDPGLRANPDDGIPASSMFSSSIECRVPGIDPITLNPEP
ncbi:MAG: GTP 3',8-cyclase MoaA [Desulfobacterales bacterium]|nr:GTP 3',8-cyclase MoaA [Desulfobacterales bacterium]